MPAEFTELEQSIITNMVITKSVKDIARMIDRLPEEVSQFVNTSMKLSGIITYQMKMDAKVKSKKLKRTYPKKLTDVQMMQLQHKETRRKNLAEKLRVEGEKRAGRRQPMYKTKQVDYSQMVTVKIDHKTYIYAKPGQEEQAKASFLRNHGLPPTQPRGVFID